MRSATPPRLRAPGALAQGGELDPAARLAVVPFAEFLGDAEQALAPVGFPPHVLGRDAGRDPQYHQVVEQIRALAHQRVAAAVERVDHHLERLLAEFLGDLGTSGVQQPRGARGSGIGMARGQHRLVQAIERIGHWSRLARPILQLVNGVLPAINHPAPAGWRFRRLPRC
jgi:hypothetical protein